MATVQFVSSKYDVDDLREVAVLLEAPESRGKVDWDEGRTLDLAHSDMSDRPFGEALFADVPATVSSATKMKALAKNFSDHLYRNQAIVLRRHPSLKLHSRPGEPEGEFIVRCREAAREARDEEVDKLSDKYEKKIEKLSDKLEREQMELAEDEAEYSARKREELLSAGESVLGVFLGRRSGRAVSTAARKRRMTTRAKADVEESKATIVKLSEDIAELEEELREEVEGITERWEEALEEVEDVKVTPRRADIEVERFALAWAPHWEVVYRDARGRERTRSVPAYLPE
jgi:hypothetical protein